MAATALALLPAATAAAPTYGVLTCSGNLSTGTPTFVDTNETNYQFHCTQDIQSYTLLINRQPADQATMDDLSPTADVYDPTNTTISSVSTVACEGVTPGNGINCYAQGGPNKPPTIPTTDWVHGSFDTTDAFCSFYKKGAKAGSTPVPSAFVQLVVSDAYGDEWGPYRLSYTPNCAKPKLPSSTKGKGGKTTKGKSTSSKGSSSKGSSSKGTSAPAIAHRAQ